MKVTREISKEEFRRIRMLADWQIRQEGYDPAEIARLSIEQDNEQKQARDDGPDMGPRECWYCDELSVGCAEDVTPVCASHYRSH